MMEGIMKTHEKSQHSRGRLAVDDAGFKTSFQSVLNRWIRWILFQRCVKGIGQASESQRTFGARPPASSIWIRFHAPALTSHSFNDPAQLHRRNILSLHASMLPGIAGVALNASYLLLLIQEERDASLCAHLEWQQTLAWVAQVSLDSLDMAMLNMTQAW